MKRVLILVALMGMPAYPVLFARAGADFTGRWTMKECTAAYANEYSRCTLELVQRGSYVTGCATYTDKWETWRCPVAGPVRNGVFEMKWKGETKFWRGTARLWFAGDALRGEYRREDVMSSGVQYCMGERIR